MLPFRAQFSAVPVFGRSRVSRCPATSWNPRGHATTSPLRFLSVNAHIIRRQYRRVEAVERDRRTRMCHPYVRRPLLTPTALRRGRVAYDGAEQGAPSATPWGKLWCLRSELSPRPGRCGSGTGLPRRTGHYPGNCPLRRRRSGQYQSCCPVDGAGPKHRAPRGSEVNWRYCRSATNVRDRRDSVQGQAWTRSPIRYTPLRKQKPQSTIASG